MSEPTGEMIQHYIESQLTCEFIDVNGDGRHFYATIVSAAFDGKRTLERQRMVYDILGDRMKSEIHALSMKTYTPEQYQQLNATPE